MCACSVTAMTTVNDKELEDLLGKCSALIPKAMEQVGCTAPIDVTSALCKRAMKDTLAKLFAESYYFVRSQAEKMKQLKAELSSTKSQHIENQKWVISLQERIIMPYGKGEEAGRSRDCC